MLQSVIIPFFAADPARVVYALAILLVAYAFIVTRRSYVGR